MGRAPWTEERIVIDRATILSRLASNGLKASRVTFSGADEVAVSRKETSVSSTRIVKAAEAYLKSNLESKKGTTWRVARKPKNVTLPETLDVDLQAELDPNSPHGYLRVNVKVMDDRKELDSVSVLFEVAYPVQKVVATRDIEAGEKISSDNIKIVTETSATPSDEDFVPPYGLVAKHSIRKDAEISRSILQVPERPMLIKRNQVVEMRLEGNGFAVRAVGQALERGRAGDLIKVRNIDTKRVIVAKIMSGGYVQPVVKK
jgi:flagella basal body P-ring formation protein FlgA